LLRPGTLPYRDAWELQRRTADEVRAGGDPVLILLEHPPVYTLGVRGDGAHILATQEALRARGAEVVRSDRGGDVTFHGPGQLVAYPILRIRELGMGPVAYVCALEQTMIDALTAFGIDAERRLGQHGVWTGGAKVGAVGVRISGGVTMHGFALNVHPDLSYFDEIVPCGIRGAGVTSMAELLANAPDVDDVAHEVVTAFSRTFGLMLEERTEAAVGR
jgi:lipoate-protein ligase B